MSLGKMLDFYMKSESSDSVFCLGTPSSDVDRAGAYKLYFHFLIPHFHTALQLRSSGGVYVSSLLFVTHVSSLIEKYRKCDE